MKIGNVIIILIFTLSIISCVYGENKRGKEVNKEIIHNWSNKDNQKIMGYTPDQYWENIDQPDFSHGIKNIKSSRFSGTIIDAPEEVDLNKRGDIPVYGINRADVFSNYHFPIDNLAVITLISAENSKHFFTSHAFRQKGTFEPITPKEESKFPPNGFVINPFVLSLKERLPTLNLETGTYYTRLISFDRVSNFVEIKVKNNGISKGVKYQNKYEITVPENEINYEKPNFLLETPTDEGIVIKAEKTEAIVGDEQLTISLAYSIPLNKNFLGNDTQLTKSISKIEGADFELNIPILISGSDIATPKQILIPVVPKNVTKITEETVVVSGYVSINLFQIPGFKPHAKNYSIYAFYGALISNPCIVEIKPSGR